MLDFFDIHAHRKLGEIDFSINANLWTRKAIRIVTESLCYILFCAIIMKSLIKCNREYIFNNFVLEDIYGGDKEKFELHFRLEGKNSNNLFFAV